MSVNETYIECDLGMYTVPGFIKSQMVFFKITTLFFNPPYGFLGKKTGTGFPFFGRGDVHRIPHIKVAHQAVEERLLQR